MHPGRRVPARPEESFMGWSRADLATELGRYEDACESSALSPISVRSYVDYARRFLAWRNGEYRPRGAVGPTRRVSLGSADVGELERDLEDYQVELSSAGRSPQAIVTYVVHARNFVRWLDGRFDPGATLRTGSEPRDRLSARDRAREERGRPRPPRPQAPIDSTWTWEGAVQSRFVAWLAGSGWMIERVADTKAREHGADILARKDNQRLAVEVKGYPQSTYATGARAGEPKKWHPASQARTYFGDALRAVIAIRESDPSTAVAMVLPAVPTFEGLVASVVGSMVKLDIDVYFVLKDGRVVSARQHLP